MCFVACSPHGFSDIPASLERELLALAITCRRSRFEQAPFEQTCSEQAPSGQGYGQVEL